MPYRNGRPVRRQSTYNEFTSPRGNKYAGECGICHQDVPAGEGILTGGPGSWGVKHQPSRWIGSPISGRMIGGCPRKEAVPEAEPGE